MRKVEQKKRNIHHSKALVNGRLRREHKPS